MIQYPINVTPQDMAVDASQNIIVRYTFQGDYLSKNIIRIYDYDSGELAYTTFLSPSSGFIGYNGDQCSFTIPANTLSNGHKYVLQMCMIQFTLDGLSPLANMPVFGDKVKVASTGSVVYVDGNITSIYPWNESDGEYTPTEYSGNAVTGMTIRVNGVERTITSYKSKAAIGDVDYGIIAIDSPFGFNITEGMDYEIYSNFYITPQYFFLTNDLPVVTLSHTCYSNRINVEGIYSQAQNVMIKKYNLKLYWSNNSGFVDSTDSSQDTGMRARLVETTKDIYSQNIKYAFWNPYYHYESQELRDAISELNEIKKEISQKGINIAKTIYGNIDTNNRQILEWTNENLNRYAEAIESWGYTQQELAGSISTVMGASSEFDGVEIAFSPILQTNNGAVLLDEYTVSEYIWGLIDRLSEDWYSEDLLELDRQGLNFDGTIIKNLIADIGDTAIQTGEAMHYTGNTGALALAEEKVNQLANSDTDYYKIICECTTQNNVVQTYDDIITINPNDYSDTSHWIGNKLYEFKVWWDREKGTVYYSLRGYGSAGRNHPEGTYELFREDLESGEIVKLNPHYYTQTGEYGAVLVGYDMTASTHGKYRYTLMKFDNTEGYRGGVIIPVHDESYTGDTLFPSATIEINENSYYITELNMFLFNDAVIHPNEKAQELTNFKIGDTWQFMCEIENTTVVNNLDRMTHVGYSQYISSTSTKVNYMSGTLSAMLGYMNCAEKKFIDTIATVRAWRKFITQPKAFLLKSQKGDVWVVNVTDNPQTTYDESYKSIPTTFTFSWAECMDVSDTCIYDYNSN